MCIFLLWVLHTNNKLWDTFPVLLTFLRSALPFPPTCKYAFYLHSVTLSI